MKQCLSTDLIFRIKKSPLKAKSWFKEQNCAHRAHSLNRDFTVLSFECDYRRLFWENSFEHFCNILRCTDNAAFTVIGAFLAIGRRTKTFLICVCRRLGLLVNVERKMRHAQRRQMIMLFFFFFWWLWDVHSHHIILVQTYIRRDVGMQCR